MDQPIVRDPRTSIFELDESTVERGSCVRLSSVTARHIEPTGTSTPDLQNPEPSNPDLRAVDLEVGCGSIVALVGPTGCGKTTLIEVIAGVLPILSGRITAPSSRAVVFQEPFLLGASLADNVTMGRGAGVDDPTVDWALGVAEASFVQELPNGIETIVGERGVSLSGGQRQRVALARAIFGRPELLLLDDTTSALDPVTERRVIDNVRRELAGTTIISVASRPSLIRMADSVVYIEAGRVIAQGTHDELLVSTPGYRELISAFERDRGEDVG
jgi:ATP-binding cassette subfamily B protein